MNTLTRTRIKAFSEKGHEPELFANGEVRFVNYNGYITNLKCIKCRREFRLRMDGHVTCPKRSRPCDNGDLIRKREHAGQRAIYIEHAKQRIWNNLSRRQRDIEIIRSQLEIQ
jgi:hypothetical protein